MSAGAEGSRAAGLSRRAFLGAGAATGLALGAVAADPRPAPAIAQAPAATRRPHARRRSIADTFEAVKREGSPAELYRFLYALPKGGDIHHHMGGAVLPEVWWEVATDSARNGGQVFHTRHRLGDAPLPPELRARTGPHSVRWLTIHQALLDTLEPALRADFKPLPELDADERRAWLSSIVLDSADEGRNEFFEYHWPRLGSLLQDITVISEVLLDNLRRFAAEGVRYLEIMSGPFGFRATDGTTMSPEAAEAHFKRLLDGEAARATGVRVRFQTVVLRFAPDAEEHVRRQSAWLASHRDLWRGLNLAGREDDNRGHPARFTDVFDEVLRTHPGIGLAIHAGESETRDTHIAETLRLGATRIGHACNLILDPDTLRAMRCGRFLLEINLISNHLLGYVPDPARHPFPIYLRQGIPCCLNTDDRGMWSSNLTDEYFVAVSRFNLSWSELVALGRWSLEFAFLDETERAELLADHDRALEAFAAGFEGASWRSRLAAVPATTHGYGRAHFPFTL